MKKTYQILVVLLALILLCFPLWGCESNSSPEATTTYRETNAESERSIPDIIHMDKDGSYTSKEDVMNYLIEYGTLPSNFITKKEARSLGWSGGSLEPYAPGKCIGGDRFGNYEGLLPEKKGTRYYECDIDTLGARKRGAKRIIYSDGGTIYYTDDHYKTFTLLYGEED